MIIPLIISLVMLCGCSDGGEKSFIEFRDKLSTADEISFNADVRAEYSDKTAKFSLQCKHNDSGTTLEVTEPELIRGIKAHTDGESTHLEYEGAILDIGKLTDNGLSPMSSVPLLMGAVNDSYVEMAWTEGDMTVARLVPEDDLVITLWLNGELEPVTAEITYKEQTVVFMEISDWKAS